MPVAVWLGLPSPLPREAARTEEKVTAEARDSPYSISAKRTIASRKSLEACSASFLPAGTLPLPSISSSNAVSNLLLLLLFNRHGWLWCSLCLFGWFDSYWKQELLGFLFLGGVNAIVSVLSDEIQDSIRMRTIGFGRTRRQYSTMWRSYCERKDSWELGIND